jgi:hypothetical protein
MPTLRIDLERRRLCGVATLLALAGLVGAAPTTPKRAKPPEWSKSVNDVFFPDAREKLEGQRPAPGSTARTASPTATPAAGMDATADAAPSAASFPWSKLIEPDSIEDEIKALQKQYSQTVTQPSPFKGGGYKTARRQLTELALLFGIIAEYDGDVRWKKESLSMRELLGRTGFACKAGSDGTFNEAKLRKEELETLVQGGGGPSAPGAEPKAAWEKVAGRAPLMQRLEIAQQQGVAPGIASADEFRKKAEVLLKESELIAAIGEVIQRPGYEYADDETYVKLAKEMRDAAMGVTEAVKNKNYDAARAASGKIDKSCSACHEGYRS